MKKILWILLALSLIAGCSEAPNSASKEDSMNPKSDTSTKSNSVQNNTEHQSPVVSIEQESNRMEVPLVSIIDGDTIKVKINGTTESVRFLLVDTAETSGPIGQQPYGLEAKNFVKELLSGDTVILEKDVSERDKYGRLLMYIYTSDGRSVQEELLRNGLARVAYVYAPNVKYVDHYRTIEKEAHEKKIGIWSIEGYAHVGHEHGYHIEVFDQNSKEKEEPSVQTTSTNNVTSSSIKTAGFIASKNSEVFHEINCPGGADKIKESNAVYFDSQEEAELSGRRMCQSKLCSLH